MTDDALKKAIEALTCSCGRVFFLASKWGRVPKLCPECRYAPIRRMTARIAALEAENRKLLEALAYKLGYDDASNHLQAMAAGTLAALDAMLSGASSIGSSSPAKRCLKKRPAEDRR